MASVQGIKQTKTGNACCKNGIHIRLESAEKQDSRVHFQENKLRYMNTDKYTKELDEYRSSLNQIVLIQKMLLYLPNLLRLCWYCVRSTPHNRLASSSHNSLTKLGQRLYFSLEGSGPRWLEWYTFWPSPHQERQRNCKKFDVPSMLLFFQVMINIHILYYLWHFLTLEGRLA